MIKLSDRLQVIADEIQRGETVADIGTDHGLLPIFLYQKGIAPKVILCDINRGPLAKAEENIRLCASETAPQDGAEPASAEQEMRQALQLRLGNGLEPLAPAEVDAVVIAGMGGVLMTEILGADLCKSHSYSKLILQPRNGCDKLRAWLLDNGFSIVAEHLVVERKYICEVLTIRTQALDSPSAAVPWGNLDLEISPLLFESRDPLLIPFIENKIRIERKVLADVTRGSDGSHSRAALAEQRLHLLQERLQLAFEVMGCGKCAGDRRNDE